MAKNPDNDKKKIIVLLASAVVIVTVAIAGVKLQWFGNSGDKVEPINDGIQQEAFFDAEDQYKQAIETVGQSVIESQTPDIQEVTGVGEDGTISYINSDGDSGILESDTSILEEDWGVSKEEMANNEKNMSEEEYFEWMSKMDEEYNQRLEEAAKKEAEAAKAATEQEVQQPQQPQPSQGVEQPQQTQETQETQEQNNTGVTDYKVYDDGTVSWKNADGTTTIDISNQREGSVRELSEYGEEVTVN